MTRYIGGLVVLALTVAACGGTTVADTPVAEAPVVVVEETASASPLEAQLGIASDPGRRQARLIELQRAAEDELVRCMRAQGFFYVVGDAEETLRGGSYLADGTREWVVENGLGIASTLIDTVASGAQTDAPDAAETNLGYVASLTPEQAAEYDRALVGDLGALGNGGDVGDGGSTGEYAPGGCWADAFSDILSRLAIVDAFGAELDALNNRLASDPRVASFEMTWSLCMEEAGYSYRNENELTDDVYARLLTIELVEVDNTTTFASNAEATELLDFEREVGLVSFDCRSTYANDLDLLRWDYEQEFLDDNRFRIADLDS